jgi:hypothetical protein
MKLQDLMLRAYDILGDDYANPQWFTKAEILAYINRGCDNFRADINDKWMRADIPVVSGTAVYTMPENAVRMQRVAFNDYTLDATSIMGLAGKDARWMETTTPQPINWTQDGCQYNQFRLWPIPSTSTSEMFTFSAAATGGVDGDTGCVTQYDSGGAFTFQADPYATGYTDPEAGIVVSITGQTIVEDDGEVMSFDVESAEQITVWCTEEHTDMASEDEEVPIHPAFHIAPLWYALSQIYQEEDSHHNGILGAFYWDMWEEELRKAAMLYANPLPRMIHKRRAYRPPPSASDELRYPNTITVDGVGVNVRWPRSSGIAGSRFSR